MARREKTLGLKTDNALTFQGFSYPIPGIVEPRGGRPGGLVKRVFWTSCTAIIGSTKTGIPESFRKWVFRFLEVPLQGLLGALPEALCAEIFCNIRVFLTKWSTIIILRSLMVEERLSDEG